MSTIIATGLTAIPHALPTIGGKQLVGVKIPKKCGCVFALKNKFHLCEIVNETMYFKKEVFDRKKAKKDATIKRNKDKMSAAKKTRNDAAKQRKRAHRSHRRSIVRVQ